MLKKKRVVTQNVIFKYQNYFLKLLSKEGGFGLNEVLGIAAGIIVAAMIVIPGMKGFAETVIERLGTWWEQIVVGNIFPTS